MTSVTPTTESNVLTVDHDTDAVLEQVPSQNQRRPKQGEELKIHDVDTF